MNDARRERPAILEQGGMSQPFDAVVSLADGYREALRSFARILESRDIETGAHSKRVVAYSLKRGATLGLEPHDLIGLEQGAALHDIGKVGIPTLSTTSRAS